MRLSLVPFTFNAIKYLFPDCTLVGKTWKNIKLSHPYLYDIKKEQRQLVKIIRINNMPFAFVVVSVFMVICLLICFVPSTFINARLGWLTFLKFPDKSACDFIALVLSVSATIISLSFVVIGFLFETVRNKTQQTFENIFRATNLYYVFSISIVSITMLLLLNILKFTFTNYVTGNFAIFSGYILFAVIISIGHLFSRVLKFLNPEKIADLSKGYLLKAAKLEILNERFIGESANVYKQTVESLSFNEKLISLFDDTPFLSMTLNNKKDCFVADVFLPLLKWPLKKIKDRIDVNSETTYYPLQVLKNIESAQPVFFFEVNTKITRFENWILPFSFMLKPLTEIESSFSKEKNKMEDRLIASAEAGNVEVLKQTLSDMDALYETYYNSK